VVTSDVLKPRAAAQSPCVPPTCGCPLLRGHLRGLGACATGCFGATSSRQRMSLKGRKGKFAGANSRLSFDIWSGNFPRATAKASNASHTGRSSHEGCAPQGPVSAEYREFSGWPLPAATAALLTPGLKGSSVKGQACLCRLTLPSVNLLVVQESITLSRLVPPGRTPACFTSRCGTAPHTADVRN